MTAHTVKAVFIIKLCRNIFKSRVPITLTIFLKNTISHYFPINSQIRVVNNGRAPFVAYGDQEINLSAFQMLRAFLGKSGEEWKILKINVKVSATR